MRLIGALALSCATWLAGPSAAGEREALVIANQDYAPEVGRLVNAREDGNLAADALRAAGFEVRLIQEAARGRLLDEATDFAGRLAAGGSAAVGVVYYVGHGAADWESGRNYLIPVDVMSADGDGLWEKSAPLADLRAVIADLAPQADWAIVIDASRDGLQRPGPAYQRSFIAEPPSPGVLTAFSAAPGAVAADGDENAVAGPFALAFAQEVLAGHDTDEELFAAIERNVMARTDLSQQPWVSSGLRRPLQVASRPARSAAVASGERVVVPIRDTGARPAAERPIAIAADIVDAHADAAEAGDGDAAEASEPSEEPSVSDAAPAASDAAPALVAGLDADAAAGDAPEPEPAFDQEPITTRADEAPFDLASLDASEDALALIPAPDTGSGGPLILSEEGDGGAVIEEPAGESDAVAPPIEADEEDMLAFAHAGLVFGVPAEPAADETGAPAADAAEGADIASTAPSGEAAGGERVRGVDPTLVEAAYWRTLYDGVFGAPLRRSAESLGPAAEGAGLSLSLPSLPTPPPDSVEIAAVAPAPVVEPRVAEEEPAAAEPAPMAEPGDEAPASDPAEADVAALAPAAEETDLALLETPAAIPAPEPEAEPAVEPEPALAEPEPVEEAPAIELAMVDEAAPDLEEDTGRTVIRDAQLHLASFGYDPGPADGVAGRRTREAAIAFRAERGLEDSDAIDQAFVELLAAAAAEGFRTGAILEAAPAPAPGPTLAALPASADVPAFPAAAVAAD
ncbi:MAG: caspase family protein, partial [Caulobacterales bacterium]|nr:caspase family protein [Caulobacterales bacterium]